MTIRFRCSECGKQYDTKDEYAGGHVKCPSCGTMLTIPAAGAADSPAGSAGGPGVSAGAQGQGGGQSVYAPAQGGGQSVYAPARAGGAVPPPAGGVGMSPPLVVKRPASVTVIAILQIIFSGLALIGLPITIAQLTGVWPMTPETEVMWEDNLYRTWTMIAITVGGAVAALWITACVGLLRLRGWGRRLAMGLLAFGLAWQGVSLAMGFYVFRHGPLGDRLAEGSRVMEFALRIAMIAMVVGALLAVGYYILLLILLTRRKVVEAFRAAALRRQMAIPGGAGGSLR